MLLEFQEFMERGIPSKIMDPQCNSIIFLKLNTFSIWGNGEEKRDYIYINDLNNIIFKLSNNSFQGVVNVCSGKPYSFSEIIKILKLFQKKKKLK